MEHDGTTLGDAIQERKRVFKELSPKEKVGYIFDYYKIPIIGGILLAILVGFLLYHYIFENQDTLVYGMFVNISADEMTSQDVPADYMTYPTTAHGITVPTLRATYSWALIWVLRQRATILRS